MNKMEVKFLTLLPLGFQLINGLKALLEFLSKKRSGKLSGFTLLELMVVIATISSLSAFAIPAYMSYIEKARITQAIAEIRMLDQKISAYDLDNGELPATLGDIGRGNLKDPWDNPYQYLNFANGKGLGKVRKDKNLVPLNHDYDLYSMGKDGLSQPPLTAKSSHDDIVRANDGNFVGKASEY